MLSLGFLKKTNPRVEQDRQAMQAAYKYYCERLEVPSKIRHYTVRAALLKIDGFTVEKAEATIAQWKDAAMKKRRSSQRGYEGPRAKSRSDHAVTSPQANPSKASIQPSIADQSAIVAQALTATRSATAQAHSPAGFSNPTTTPVPLDLNPNTQVRRVRSAVKEEALALLRLPLAEKLQAAGLIKPYQLEIAQMEYSVCGRQGSVVDILLEKGWVNATLVKFFGVTLLQSRSRSKSLPIEHYLQLAGMLDSRQVASLSMAQQQMGGQIADLAVQRGLVQSKTINFIHACLNA